MSQPRGHHGGLICGCATQQDCHFPVAQDASEVALTELQSDLSQPRLQQPRSETGAVDGYDNHRGLLASSYRVVGELVEQGVDRTKPASALALPRWLEDGVQPGMQDGHRSLDRLALEGREWLVFARDDNCHNAIHVGRRAPTTI